MKRGAIGKYAITKSGSESVRAFLPDPLPPDPPLIIDGERQMRLEQALLALGRLDSVSTLLPDPHLFLYTYVRKEAVLSSQIEGTQSSLSDLLLTHHRCVCSAANASEGPQTRRSPETAATPPRLHSPSARQR